MLIRFSFFVVAWVLGGGLQPCVAQQLGSHASTTSNSDSYAYGSASNQQLNSSASNSFGGNNFSYQYNTEFGRASEYIFSSRQIRCEGPRAFLGVWADPQPDYWYSGSLYGTNAWDMRAGAGLSVPIGSLNETCKAMSLRLEQQLRFDTSIGIVNACAGMLRRGVAFDARLLAVFPELRPCGSLSLLGDGASLSRDQASYRQSDHESRPVVQR